MPRVEDIADTSLFTGAGISHHVFQVAGGDNSQALAGRQSVEVEGRRVFHGSGVKAGYLVIGAVGGDIGGGGKFILDDLDAAAGYLVLICVGLQGFKQGKILALGKPQVK